MGCPSKNVAPSWSQSKTGLAESLAVNIGLAVVPCAEAEVQNVGVEIVGWKGWQSNMQLRMM